MCIRYDHHEEFRCLALRFDRHEVLVGTMEANILRFLAKEPIGDMPARGVEGGLWCAVRSVCVWGGGGAVSSLWAGAHAKCGRDRGGMGQERANCSYLACPAYLALCTGSRARGGRGEGGGVQPVDKNEPIGSKGIGTGSRQGSRAGSASGLRTGGEGGPSTPTRDRTASGKATLPSRPLELLSIDA